MYKCLEISWLKYVDQHMVYFRHFSDTSSTKTVYRPKASNSTCQVHPCRKQPLKMAIILAAREFESLRLRFVEEGLAMWLVLFVLPRIDWGKGIG